MKSEDDMASESTSVHPRSEAATSADELGRALAELREANERLVVAGVQMQQLAEVAQHAREEAEAASQAKDEFLATLSHELRTPLNAILGWTHMLRRTDMTGAAADRALEIIERNARLQSQLIADLLQVSQIVTGKLRLEVELVNLAPLVAAGLDSVRPAAIAKAITLKSHIDTDVPRVLADASRVEQIIWNLLSNAIKFTPRDGHIDVTLKQVGSSAAISVTDSGVGIDRDFLPHMFDRFRQADATSHRLFGGMGLGLTIVRQLIELHGGTVTGESAGIGRGATFTLTFPVPPTTAAREHAERVRREPSLQGLRVLVVEDDPDSRELILALLQAKGASVTAVSSAREAIAQFDGHAPDVMVADIGLPHEDGYELIRKVRALEDGHHRSIPAVAVTAYARSEDREKALAAGFQLHMAKPFEPDAFVRTVALLASRLRPRR